MITKEKLNRDNVFICKLTIGPLWRIYESVTRFLRNSWASRLQTRNVTCFRSTQFAFVVSGHSCVRLHGNDRSITYWQSKSCLPRESSTVVRWAGQVASRLRRY